LGRTPEARDALLKLLAAAPDAAWVLDADALWHLADQPYDLPEHCVLTPHEGEALRLLGEDPLTGSWGGDRLELVDALAARYGVHVLLKGAGNLLASEGHTVLIPGSARALARGGSGDLLAGLIGALSARGARLEDAVHLAVRLQLQAAAGLSAGRAEVVSQEHLATLMGEAWQVLHES
jgi:NAD(P)H-hydrate epimerase